MDSDLRAREERAYAESWSDGIVDVFVGLAVVWIGVAWLWIEPLAAVAGVFPAVLVPTLPAVRKRLVEPRGGYVGWAAPRRRWERDQVVRLLWIGVGALVLGVAGLSVAAYDLDAGRVVAGLPAALLAVPAFIVGFASGIRRVLVYGGMLLVAAAGTILLEADPGADLLVAGTVILVSGLVLWARFERAHPVRDA